MIFQKVICYNLSFIWRDNICFYLHSIPILSSHYKFVKWSDYKKNLKIPKLNGILFIKVRLVCIETIRSHTDFYNRCVQMNLNNNEASDITWNQCHYAHKNDQSEDLLEELHCCEYAEFESVVCFIASFVLKR